MSSDNTPNSAGGGGTAKWAPVTDRVNVEPVILRGMTMSEAQLVAAVSMVVFLLLGAGLWFITGFWQVVLILGIFGPSACLWYASAYLAQIKRGRPDAYYTQAIHIWWAQKGLVKHKFTRHEGYWSLGRDLGLNLSSPLDPNEAIGSPQHSSLWTRWRGDKADADGGHPSNLSATSGQA
jgi:conjugative transfer region protein (TIGR03750 family)